MKNKVAISSLDLVQYAVRDENGVIDVDASAAKLANNAVELYSAIANAESVQDDVFKDAVLAVYARAEEETKNPEVGFNLDALSSIVAGSLHCSESFSELKDKAKEWVRANNGTRESGKLLTPVPKHGKTCIRLWAKVKE